MVKRNEYLNNLGIALTAGAVMGIVTTLPLTWIFPTSMILGMIGLIGIFFSSKNN